MTHRTEIAIEPGATFQIEGMWFAYLLRINQKAYDRFELVFDDYETAMLVEVDTRGFNRTPLEGAHRNIDSLVLTEGDIVTVPGLHERTAHAISEVREGRFRFRLEKKYAAAVNVDVVTSRDIERRNEATVRIADPERPSSEVLDGLLYPRSARGAFLNNSD
ncbi:MULTISPECIES: hypothetical protein [unclassified Microbacterium]|uniref:hypothetical protein n=1 Tax=unclassified Microbacterium TaxID=2609290 RepID=UPI002882FF97|nr:MULTISPECIES: hypothetical protein [unclassified Microbacterium]